MKLDVVRFGKAEYFARLLMEKWKYHLIFSWKSGIL